jgi:hypothetical protein
LPNGRHGGERSNPGPAVIAQRFHHDVAQNLIVLEDKRHGCPARRKNTRLAHSPGLIQAAWLALIATVRSRQLPGSRRTYSLGDVIGEALSELADDAAHDFITDERERGIAAPTLATVCRS